MEDRYLLRQFVDSNSQEAFAALTTRYLSLVYSVCLRELGDNALAEDVTQAVFLLLARKAPTLRREVVLSGWLFQTARFAAKNARTREQRRKAYEQKAAEAMQQSEDRDDAVWSEIEPLLNQSLAVLREGERECVLLRFFQGLSFAEVGTSLGLSEEAARKRVARALEKMRQLMTKNGVVVPSAALIALLTAHAAKAAPASCQAGIALLKTGALTVSPIYPLSEGILHAMKIAQWKAAGFVAVAVTLVGSVVYAIAQNVSTESTHDKLMLESAINVRKSDFSAPAQKDAVRNVVLHGKVRYEDGPPAANVSIGAQIQLKAMMAQDDVIIKQQSKPQNKTVTIHYSKEQQEESWNNAVSKSDGTYVLPIGANIPYNVMVFDETGKWVAAALEGVSGAQNTTVNVPDLVLTRGSIVVGKVTTSFGLPMPHVMVGSYGPDRPRSTAAANMAQTDLSGYYCLRVAPGQNRVYVGLGTGEGKVIQIKPGQITTADLRFKP